MNKSLIFQIKLLVLKWRNPFTNFLTKVFLPNLIPVTGFINVGSFDLAYVAVKKIFIFFKYCSKELNPSKTVAFMWSVLCFWQYFIHCLICTSCFHSLFFFPRRHFTVLSGIPWFVSVYLIYNKAKDSFWLQSVICRWMFCENVLSCLDLVPVKLVLLWPS